MVYCLADGVTLASYPYIVDTFFARETKGIVQKNLALGDILSQTHKRGQPIQTIVVVNENKMAAHFKFIYRNKYPTAVDHIAKNRRAGINWAVVTERCPSILITTSGTMKNKLFADVARLVFYDLPAKEVGGFRNLQTRVKNANQGKEVYFLFDSYLEKDADMAPSIIKMMEDSHSEVPDFLLRYRNIR